MVALRLVLMIVVTGLASYWAYDFIETGAPSVPVAMALLACAVGLVAFSAAGAFKKKTGDTGA